MTMKITGVLHYARSIAVAVFPSLCMFVDYLDVRVWKMLTTLEGRNRARRIYLFAIVDLLPWGCSQGSEGRVLDFGPFGRRRPHCFSMTLGYYSLSLTMVLAQAMVLNRNIL